MNLEAMKAQTIGVEVEMVINRKKAATVAGELFGRPETVEYVGEGYSTWKVLDSKGRAWRFQRDGSIRADSDDICDPERIKVQYEYLDNHPDIAIISSYIDEFDVFIDHPCRMYRMPVTCEIILIYFLEVSLCFFPYLICPRPVFSFFRFSLDAVENLPCNDITDISITN